MKRFHIGAIRFLLSLGLIGACVHVARAQPWAVTDVPIMQLSKENNRGLEKGHIWELRYSPDGRYLAVGWSGAGESGARQIELRDAQSLEIITTLDVKAYIQEMRFSPNGKVLAFKTWSESGYALELWDLQTRKRIKSLPLNGYPRQMSFSPDSVLFIASVYQEDVRRADVHVWEVQTGKAVKTLSGLNVDSAHFSPDGKFLAAGGWVESRSLIKVWEVGTWKEVNTFEGFDYSLLFSPDGTLLAAKGVTEERGWIKIWEVGTGKVVMSVEGDHPYTSLAFSPDGTLLVTGERNSREIFKRGDPPLEVFIRFWDVQTGKAQRALLHGRASRSAIETQVMGFGPGGKWIASLGEDTDGGVVLKLWDVKTGELLKQLKPDGAWRRNLVAMSSDGALLASTPDGMAISVLNVVTGEKTTKQVFDNTFPIAFSRISPDGKALVTAGESGPVQLWNLGSGKHLQRLHLPDRRDLVYTRDGRLLAASWMERRIRVWDVLTNEELFAASWNPEDTVLWAEGFRVRSMAGQTVHLSPNGLWLAAIAVYDFQRRNVAQKYNPREHTYKSLLKVWNILTGDERTLLNDEKGINSFAFSPDDELLAVGFRDGIVEVWDVASGERVKRFAGNPRNSAIVALSFHPDGQRLAAVSDGKLFLWEMPSGKMRQTIAGVYGREPAFNPHFPLYKPLLIFSPDGQLIATDSPDNRHVVLWDVATGKQYKILPERAESIAFSPDGKLVVTGASDGTVRVWVR